MEPKKHGQFYWLPPQAKIGVSDREVSFTELADLISSLSFDNPTAKVNYSIEVVPTREATPKKSEEASGGFLRNGKSR